MSNANLVALKPALLAIPAAEVREPWMPVAVFLQEAADLQTLVADPDVRGRLSRVGLDAAHLDALDAEIDAARAAQSEWSVVRDRRKSAGQQELEARAHDFRKGVLEACRWNLRGDRVALATLSAIAEGETVEDLTQDLADLATLMEGRTAAFAKDDTFDVASAIKQARTLVGDLQGGVSAERLTTDQTEAKDLRDRAYTYLYGRVRDVREAGRYAFKDNEDLARKFASAYLRRRRSQASGGEGEPSLPPVEG